MSAPTRRHTVWHNWVIRHICLHTSIFFHHVTEAIFVYILIRSSPYLFTYYDICLKHVTAVRQKGHDPAAMFVYKWQKVIRHIYLHVTSFIYFRHLRRPMSSTMFVYITWLWRRRVGGSGAQRRCLLLATNENIIRRLGTECRITCTKQSEYLTQIAFYQQ